MPSDSVYLLCVGTVCIDVRGFIVSCGAASTRALSARLAIRQVEECTKVDGVFLFIFWPAFGVRLRHTWRQLNELTPEQLMLALGLRSIMRERNLDPQRDSSLKAALPPFMRHATILRAGKAQVDMCLSCWRVMLNGDVGCGGAVGWRAAEPSTG